MNISRYGISWDCWVVYLSSSSVLYHLRCRYGPLVTRHRHLLPSFLAAFRKTRCTVEVSLVERGAACTSANHTHSSISVSNSIIVITGYIRPRPSVCSYVSVHEALLFLRIMLSSRPPPNYLPFAVYRVYLHYPYLPCASSTFSGTNPYLQL